MFRGERPQKGRLRQFHQIGVESMGPNTSSPYLDAETIGLAVTILKNLGLKNFQLKINTLGSPADKNNFSKLLRERLSGDMKGLSAELQTSFNQNIFRILDSKDEHCQKIVSKLKIDYSYLSAEGKNYYAQVKKALDGLDVRYEETPTLVRGLDYYTQTVFEITDSSLGSQDALGAGGRYNGLVAQLGGGEVDAVGFALGIERIILAMGEAAVSQEPLQFFIIALDEGYLSKAFSLLSVLRSENIPSDMSYRVSSMKSQMRLSDKMKARFVVILGEEEMKSDLVTIKDMKTGTQIQEKQSHFNKNLFDKLIHS